MHIKSIVFLLLAQTFLFAQTVGLASWYGEKFQGRTTASGESFDMYGYTGAHKTLPFGTIVTVTNLQNGKSVNVKVNDRGPYQSKRIMDISFGAAKAIGLIEMGTTTVSIVPKKVEKVTVPVKASSELSVYSPTPDDLASMKAYALSIIKAKKELPQKAKNTQSFQVQIASFVTKQGAEEFIVKKKNKGYNMAVVSLYSKVLKQMRHKVVIITDSKASAMKIINSKQYSGAYLLH